MNADEIVEACKEGKYCEGCIFRAYDEEGAEICDRTEEIEQQMAERGMHLGCAISNIIYKIKESEDYEDQDY